MIYKMNTVHINRTSARLVENLCNDILRARSPATPKLKSIKKLFERYFSLNDEFRFYVMHRISNAKNRTARRLLVEILKRDRSILVRHEAAFALGCIGHAEDLPHVRSALLHDDNSLVRHEAAMALGVMGQRRDILTLKRGLADTNPMVVQSCRAAITLIQLRCAGAGDVRHSAAVSATRFHLRSGKPKPTAIR